MQKPRELTTFGILLRLLLLLSIAISGQFSLKARYWEQYYPETVIINYSDLLLQSIPEQVKSLGAGLMRITADEYMHIGPYKKAKQNFIAGSFAGNTEIMTLLKLALYLEPGHIETYTIMSQNLSMHLDRFEDGIRLIQQGILANKNSPELHKLYAAGAYCHGFAESYTFGNPQSVKNNRAAALNYIDAAIASYETQQEHLSSDSFDVFANIGNYRLMKSRFLLDIGKKQEALAAWQLVPLENRNGLLATYFSLMEQGIEVPATPELMFEEMLASQSRAEKKPPYLLPEGWYQTLFFEPADTLKSLSSLLKPGMTGKLNEHNPLPAARPDVTEPNETPAADHNQSAKDSSCDHAGHSEHECQHQNAGHAWTIFTEARAAILQAALMIVCGLLIRRFFTRHRIC